jgi:AcrR family transcriptional regulator
LSKQLGTESLTAPIQTPPAAAATASTTARMAGLERRQQILRVAMSLFSRHGFRGTTTKEIAREAGVSEAMVFRHFATKEELYRAILDNKACVGGLVDPRELLSEAIARKDDRAVFEELAMAMMCHHEEDLEFLRLLTHSALEGHQLREMFWDRNVRPLYEFLGAYIHERQRDGVMREIDPRIAVRAFLGMIIHHSLNNTLWDQPRRLLDITNECAAREFTELLLRGLAADAHRGQRETKGRARVASPVANRTRNTKKK